KLLSVFYYILGGIGILFGFFPLLYVVIGGAIAGGGIPSQPGSEPPPPTAVGFVLIALGLFLTLLLQAVAIANLLTGKWLSQRRNRTFCFVIACITCAGFPLGTALGVFTIIVLQRPSVRALFDPARKI